jgi:hypothetical protein
MQDRDEGDLRHVIDVISDTEAVRWISGSVPPRQSFRALLKCNYRLGKAISGEIGHRGGR